MENCLVGYLEEREEFFNFLNSDESHLVITPYYQDRDISFSNEYYLTKNFVSFASNLSKKLNYNIIYLKKRNLLKDLSLELGFLDTFRGFEKYYSLCLNFTDQFPIISSFRDDLKLNKNLVFFIEINNLENNEEFYRKLFIKNSNNIKYIFINKGYEDLDLFYQYKRLILNEEKSRKEAKPFFDEYMNLINPLIKSNDNSDLQQYFNMYSKYFYSIIKHEFSKLNLIECPNDYLDEIMFFSKKKNRVKQISQEIDSSYIKNIDIENYFSIENIKIENNLSEKREIYIVGENGDGKTILLQAIILALKGDESVANVLEYIKDTKGKMSLVIDSKKGVLNYFGALKVKNVFAYGINRNKTSSSKSEVDSSGYSGLFDTNDYRKTTFLYYPLDILKKDEKVVNEFIEELNKLLNCYLEERVIEIERESSEIKFIEHKNEIEFEKLSEGYKSTIIWVCDMFVRFYKNYPDRSFLEFEGVILVDEIDLYLHPRFKYEFVHNLRKIFPKVQFIFTTHSLVTTLGASKDAIFYRIYKDENGKSQLSYAFEDFSEYTANMLISSPMFNLDTFTSRAFKSKEQNPSSDDYSLHKIHAVIKEELKNRPLISDEELKAKIKAELKNRLKAMGERAKK